MPTLVQYMSSLAFALALVAPPSVLGWDTRGNINVHLFNKYKQSLIVTHALFRSGRECVDNPRSYSLFDRWLEQCRYWGQNSFGATHLNDTAGWQKTLAFYCQVIRAHYDCI